MIYRDLDLELIRCFLVVAETRNFTNAGQRLGRSQSAVSVRIKKLEEMFGLMLLERNSHDVSLTRDGVRLLQKAKYILAQSEQLFAEMQRPIVSGKLRIGFLEYIAPHRIPVILDTLQRRLPNAELTFQVGLSSALMTALNAGELDVALALHNPEREDSFVVAEDQLVWVESKVYSSRENASNLSLCLMQEPCIYRKHAILSLNDAEFAYREVLTANSILAVRNAITSGMGVTVLGESSLGGELQIASIEKELPELPKLQLALVGECENKIALADAFKQILAGAE